MIKDNKLLFIAPSFYTFGGVQYWLSYVVPGLESLGWDVTVGLTSGPRYHCPERFLAEIPFRHTCVIHTDTCTPESRARAVMRVVMKRQPDLVMGVNVADTYEGCRRARLRGWSGKMMMTLHGLEADYYVDLQRLSAHVDTVLGTNRLTCRAIESEGGMPADRILYAPYGVEIPSLRIPPHDDRRIVMAYSGRLESIQKRIYDLPLILEALERRGISVKCLIAGSGPEEDAVRAACESMSFHQIEFMGYIPPEQLHDRLYGHADILLITSSWETGPIVAWEAMASGAVVVSSRYTGSLAEGALKDRVNCRLFDVGNVEQATDCICELNRNRKSFAELSAAGRDLVESRYTRRISIQTFHIILKNALHRAPLAPCQEPVWLNPSCGRLDRLFGQYIGESLRSALGKKAASSSPGAEWPHAYCYEKTDQIAFLNRLSEAEK